VNSTEMLDDLFDSAMSTREESAGTDARKSCGSVRLIGDSGAVGIIPSISFEVVKDLGTWLSVSRLCVTWDKMIYTTEGEWRWAENADYSQEHMEACCKYFSARISNIVKMDAARPQGRSISLPRPMLLNLLRATPSTSDAAINGFEVESKIMLPVGDDLCHILEGGDASYGGHDCKMRSVAHKDGACLYCEARKKVWYKPNECKTAVRRNVYRALVCSHLDPFSRLPIPQEVKAKGPPICPGCKKKVTPAFEASERARLQALSKTARTKAKKEHAESHFLYELLEHKNVYSDHKFRALTLLHNLLNALSSSLAVTLATGSTEGQRHALNKVLEDNNFWFHMKEKGVSNKDQKPTGPECRKILFTPKPAPIMSIIMELLAARYGAPQTREERLLAEAYERERIQGAEAVLQPTTASRRSDVRASASTAESGADADVILAALNDMPEASPAVAPCCRTCRR